MTGNLDEDVKDMTVAVGAQVHAGWIPVPVKVDVPISIKPGFPKGPISLSLSKATTNRTVQVGSPDVGVDISGNIKDNDGNNEEIVCLQLGGSHRVVSSETYVV